MRVSMCDCDVIKHDCDCDCDVTRLPTCHQEEADTSSTTVAILTHNAQLVTVALDGVAAAADAVGADFDQLLLTVMYPLLHKLG